MTNVYHFCPNVNIVTWFTIEHRGFESTTNYGGARHFRKPVLRLSKGASHLEKADNPKKIHGSFLAHLS